MKLKEYQKAYGYNEKAIETVRDELKNKTWVLYNNKSIFLEKLGRYDEAKFATKRTNDLENSNKKVINFCDFLKR